MADKEIKKYEVLDYMHEADIDPEHYQVYLIGREDVSKEETMEMGEPGVEYRMANRLIKNLHYLSGLNSTRPILMHMKTCGGHVHEGMAIYDTMLSISNPITCINYTHARSMSSIIFQAANKRVMMPNSNFMFHEGDTAISGTPKQVRSVIEFDKKFDDVMLTIYAERIKYTPTSKFKTWTISRIKDMLKHEMDQKEDVLLTATEAVDWGFADEIFNDYESVFTYTKQQRGIK